MNVRGYVYEGFQNHLWIGADLSYWLVDKDSQFPRMPPCQRGWCQMATSSQGSTNGPQVDDPTTVWSLLHPRLVGSSHVFHSPQRLQCSPNLWHGSNGQCTHFQYQGHIAAQCSPPKYVNSPELMSSFPQNIVCHPFFGPTNACGNQDVSLTAKTSLFIWTLKGFYTVSEK